MLLSRALRVRHELVPLRQVYAALVSLRSAYRALYLCQPSLLTLRQRARGHSHARRRLLICYGACHTRYATLLRRRATSFHARHTFTPMPFTPPIIATTTPRYIRHAPADRLRRKVAVAKNGNVTKQSGVL